jgi:hypothetical protein
LSSKAELQNALVLLVKIHRQIEALNERNDEGRWPELIALRRELAIHTAATTKLASEFQPLVDDQATSRTMREKLSQVRAANANHQSNWPAPLVARDPDGYAASAREVQAKASEFLSWFSKTLEQYR